MSFYRLVDARHGRFLVNPRDFYIGQAILEYGEYAEAEWQVLDQLLLPGKDAIEVGANIGSHSVSMAKKLAGLGQCLLVVEPQPIVFQNLCANLALNGLLNVIAENAAVNDTPGYLSFDLPNYQVEGSNFGAVTMRENGGGNQRVRAERLDDLVPEDFDVGLIKIDVEGFEQQVLQSVAATIERCRPMIYLENDRPDKSAALIKWLWAADYDLWWNELLLFNPGFSKVENLYGDAGSMNMIALPRESQTRLVGFPPVTNTDFHPYEKEEKANG